MMPFQMNGVVKPQYTLVNGHNGMSVGIRQASFITNVIITVPYKDVIRVHFMNRDLSGVSIMMYDSVYRPDYVQDVNGKRLCVYSLFQTPFPHILDTTISWDTGQN